MMKKPKLLVVEDDAEPRAGFVAVSKFVVANGMTVLGVESYWQPLVIGLIILGGVVLDTYRRRLSLSELLHHLTGRTGAAAAGSSLPSLTIPSPNGAADTRTGSRQKVSRR